MTRNSPDRRSFLLLLPQMIAAVSVGFRWRRSLPMPRPVQGRHPTPRPGIDASHVMPSADVPEHAREAFDRVREIPEIVDGIRCQCGCADLPGHYSLLSCYEAPEAMARHCLVCQGEGVRVARLHAEGRSLDDIRAAIELEFG